MVHKHELHQLTMTITQSKASGLFEFRIFFYQACWLIYMNISTAVTYFLLSNLLKILPVAFLLPVSIVHLLMKANKCALSRGVPAYTQSTQLRTLIFECPKN